MVHGEEEALKVQEAAKAVFGGGGNNADMPTAEIENIGEGMNILDLLTVTNLAPSKGEARRLVQQGGISVNGEKIADTAHMVTGADFTDGECIVKKGKKVFLKVICK